MTSHLGLAILDRAGEGLGGFLPRLGGALALLLVGVLVAAVVRRLVVRGLRAAGADDLAERYGINDTLERFGLPRSVAAAAGGALRLAVLVVVAFAALSLLGLEFLSTSLNEGILFLPRLLVALVLLLAGVIVGQFARRASERLAGQMDLAIPVGPLVEIAVIAIFAVTALTQVGISTDVLVLLVGVVFAATALTVALAFGLGGREMAKEIGARRYVAGGYAVGQEISVGDVRGRIESIESTSTVLRTATGDRVRVPNSRLVGSIVTVHG